jgi:general secretion pathway protein M
VKDWFESLQARERIFVALGAMFVVLLLLYGLGWAPLAKRHAVLQADVQAWQRSLTELRPLRARSSAPGLARSTPAPGALQSPIIIVDQTLSSRGLDRYRRRSQPTSSNGIRVEFENVAFDELVLWLGELSEQYAMHVQAGSFSTGPQIAAGRINATITLERAP